MQLVGGEGGARVAGLRRAHRVERRAQLISGVVQSKGSTGQRA